VLPAAIFLLSIILTLYFYHLLPAEVAYHFEDGTPAKFWGTNLCFSACFPTKKQAEIIADRLAFFGFNAVRLHHMDSRFEPQGIFEDTCPNCKDPQMKKTGKLSRKQLDRLDYLIYQLKQHGIYVDINLLVKRQFTLADGIKDADKLEGGAKPASLFDPKIIELQKQYAKNLLTHYNPYTKMRYCDDSAVALIEITNENSILSLRENSLPKYYLSQIENKWDSFSKKDYKTIEEAKKAFYINIEKVYFKQMTDFLKKECSIKVPIAGIGGYLHSEDIKTQEYCDFIDTHTYWDHPKFPNEKWDRNNFRIHNKSTLSDKKLGVIEKIIKNDPKNNKPYTISEWNHCYPNQYAYETPILLAAYAVKNGWDGLFQFAFSHGWKNKPNFDAINYYFDIIANPQQLILCSLGSFIFHKTDDLNITFQEGIYKINSSKIKGVVGFIKDKTFDFDSFTITASQNGAVLLYSPEGKSIEKSNRLILVTISEVKNKDSAWNKEKRFNWGTAPTFLRNMSVKVILNTDKVIDIYLLDNKGIRANKIKTQSEGDIIVFSTEGTNSPWFEINLK